MEFFSQISQSVGYPNAYASPTIESKDYRKITSHTLSYLDITRTDSMHMHLPGCVYAQMNKKTVQMSCLLLFYNF